MYSVHLIFTFVFYSVTVDGKALFKSDYVYYKGAEGWLKVHNPENWRSARLICNNEGAILASPENEDLLFAMSAAYLANSKTPETYMFTGIHDTFSKGLFASLEGTPLAQIPIPWAPGKPDSYNPESCLSMSHNGMLSDSKCTDELPFICYKRDPTTPTCSNGYTLDTITGSCYKFHSDEQYWRDAYAVCYHEGGHLATINSNHETDVLTSLFKNNEQRLRGKSSAVVTNVVHIGLLNWLKGDGQQWMFIDGEELNESYVKWHSGEPNTKQKQFCGGLYITGDLDDVDCYDGDAGNAKRAFICEKKHQVEDTASVNINFVQGS